MNSRQGFTLVELVIVVLVLGIIVAAAAPKLMDTAANARESSVRQSLATVRNAIELYKAYNGGNLPGQGANLPKDLEVFIQGSFPVSPVGAQVNTVTYNTGPIAADGAPIAGWKYSMDTGQFICNCSDPLPSDPVVTYDEL